MIVFRYLFKEVLFSLLAVTAVLLIIIMSGRFINYLADAANGELSADVLLALIGYRMPGFLELILPLGLFLGILLAYGRLYLENEMTVLNACGFSPNRLQQVTLGPALLVAVLVGLLSLWITPWSTTQVEQILKAQESLTEFETLAPGRFQETSSGRRVTYTERLLDSRTRLNEVFISERSQQRGDPTLGLIVAEKGSQYIEAETGSRFLLLENGYRYEGVPGQADYRKIRFQQYGVRIRESAAPRRVNKIETLPTLALIGSEQPEFRAQLHWRLSLPLLCIVVSLLAVPLSKVNPRQGRFARLLPSILLYLGYLSILTSIRSGLEEGEIRSSVSLWLVHLAFLLLALNLHFLGAFWSRQLARLSYGFWRLLPGGRG